VAVDRIDAATGAAICSAAGGRRTRQRSQPWPAASCAWRLSVRRRALPG